MQDAVPLSEQVFDRLIERYLAKESDVAGLIGQDVVLGHPSAVRYGLPHAIVHIDHVEGRRVSYSIRKDFPEDFPIYLMPTTPGEFDVHHIQNYAVDDLVEPVIQTFAVKPKRLWFKYTKDHSAFFTFMKEDPKLDIILNNGLKALNMDAVNIVDDAIKVNTWVHNYIPCAHAPEDSYADLLDYSRPVGEQMHDVRVCRQLSAIELALLTLLGNKTIDVVKSEYYKKVEGREIYHIFLTGPVESEFGPLTIIYDPTEGFAGEYNRVMSVQIKNKLEPRLYAGWTTLFMQPWYL